MCHLIYGTENAYADFSLICYVGQNCSKQAIEVTRQVVTGNVKYATFLVPGMFVPFRERGNNFVPTVLKSLFNSVPRSHSSTPLTRIQQFFRPCSVCPVLEGI